MLNICQKKMTLVADVFPEILLPKIWLDKCLKRHVSADPYTDKKTNGSKNCCNLNSSTFTIFINHCEDSSIGKTLC